MALFDLNRGRVISLLIGTVCALGLFFGLFFGLIYPEVVRHGWPLTRYTVLDSRINERFCCEARCDKGCVDVPSDAVTCRSITSQIDSQSTPQACAANSSSCPALSGPCDGGYKCCSTCCSTCTTCSTTCSFNAFGGTSCSTSCDTTSCNCYCCDSVNHRFCTYTCPTCYTAVIDITYKINSGKVVNATYRHETNKNHDGATGFLDQHRIGTSGYCYYNPRNIDEVAFDVSFTAWKWAICAIFGMVPLLLATCYGSIACIFLPLIAGCRRHYRRRSQLAGNLGSALVGRRSDNDNNDGSGKESTRVFYPGATDLQLRSLERQPRSMPVAQPDSTDENAAEPK